MEISGLILTKNNAASVDYALASIRDYMDEIVVLDSGSTDATLDIARKYTDKIYIMNLIMILVSRKTME